MNEERTMKSNSKVDPMNTFLSVRVGKTRYYPMQVTLGDKKRTLRFGDVAYLDREIKRISKSQARRAGRC